MQVYIIVKISALIDQRGSEFAWFNVTVCFIDILCYRNHYYCSVYAARMMVPRRKGLIVNVSSVEGLRYLFNTAYGVGEQAVSI